MLYDRDPSSQRLKSQDAKDTTLLHQYTTDFIRDDI